MTTARWAASPLVKALPGVTLVELGMCLMILAVLSVGVSALVKSGVETQMSERNNQQMQTIAMGIVEDLRHDFRTADTVQLLNGGNTLQMNTNGQVVTYNLNTGNGQFSRMQNGAPLPKIYNDPTLYTAQMQVDCVNTASAPVACFQSPPGTTNTAGQPTRVWLPAIRVRVVPAAGNAGTPLDQAFGVNNFILRDFTFDVASAIEFQ